MGGAVGGVPTVTAPSSFTRGSGSTVFVSVPASEGATFTLSLLGTGFVTRLLDCGTSPPGVCSVVRPIVVVGSDGDATPVEALTVTVRVAVQVQAPGLDSTEGDPVMDFPTTLTATVTGTDGTTGSGTSAPASTRIVVNPDAEAVIALTTTAPAGVPTVTTNAPQTVTYTATLTRSGL